MFWALLRRAPWLCACGFASGLCIPLQLPTWLLLCQWLDAWVTMALQYVLKSGFVLSLLIPSVEHRSGYSGPFMFSYEFLRLFQFCEKYCWCFHGDYVEPTNHVRSYGHFNSIESSNFFFLSFSTSSLRFHGFCWSGLLLFPYWNLFLRFLLFL